MRIAFEISYRSKNPLAIRLPPRGCRMQPSHLAKLVVPAWRLHGLWLLLVLV